VSATPAGPYTYTHSFRPHGEEARDFTVFKARLPALEHAPARARSHSEEGLIP
jgi:hypothetical protein